MYCKHCGKEIDDNSSFCKYCGKPQDNRVSTPNSLIDFVTKRPITSSYILWVIINVVCLSRGEKVGEYYDLLYPRFCLNTFWNRHDYFNLDNYQITDFVVYTFLIPLVLFLGYHYFKKVKSIKYRVGWGLWFLFNILWYNMSGYEDGYIRDKFFPFTKSDVYPYFFSYYSYDLSELVVYTMLVPIVYWGYLYFKGKKSTQSN